MNEEFERNLDLLAEAIAKSESVPSVINPKRVMEMHNAYVILKGVIDHMPGVSLTYKLHSPYPSVGYINVEGKVLSFASPELFKRVSALADNVEVYSLKRNAVRLTFTFHGLTQ